MTRHTFARRAAMVGVIGVVAVAAFGESPVVHAAPASAAATPTTAVPRGVMPLPRGGSTSPKPSSAATATSTAPQLSYYGGHVVSSVHVIEVLYGGGTYETEVAADPSTAPSIGSFYRGVTNSSYLDWMNEYNTGVSGGTGQSIGRGAFVSQVEIMPAPQNTPSSNGKTVTDDQVQNELERQIAAGNLQAPNANTLYAIYFPLNVVITMAGPGGSTLRSGIDFCAYHGTTLADPEAYYSVLPDFNSQGMSGCGSGTEFQRVTAVSSHELAEVITDPEVGRAMSNAPPLGWYDVPDNQESADLCENGNNSEATVAGGDGNTYTVQKVWSNQQKACVVAGPPPRFSPQGVGQPSATVTPDGSTQLVFWKGADNHLAEAWYTGRWNGPVDFNQLGTLSSAPAAAVTKDGSTQVVFWQGPGGHLFEAWYAGSWNGPVDWTAAAFGGRGLMASAPSVVTMKNGQQLVFWRGTDGHLWEAWYSGSWNGPVDFTSFGALASAPTAAVTPDGSTQLVFWQGTDNRLTEAWYTGVWNGPVEWTNLGSVTSSPSVTVTPDGSTQLVFYQGPGGHLFESWYSGSWNGPVDWTAGAFGGNGLLSAPPSATVTPDGSTQLVFWQGAGSTLWEGWYAGAAWHGPVDFSAG